LFFVKVGMSMNNTLWEQQEIVRLLKGQAGSQYQEATETNRAIIRDWVRSLLQTTEVSVTFVKADGTVRNMRCTLDIGRMPLQNIQVHGSIESRDSETQRVFDLDLQQWRSFRYDRLRKVTAEVNFE
jgi:hypothetical protein